MKTRTIVSIILATATVVLGTIFFVTKLRKKHHDGCGCDFAGTDDCIGGEDCDCDGTDEPKHLAVMQMPALMTKMMMPIPVHLWQQIK